MSKEVERNGLNPYYTGRYSIRPNSILHYISIHYINITPIHIYFLNKKAI